MSPPLIRRVSVDATARTTVSRSLRGLAAALETTQHDLDGLIERSTGDRLCADVVPGRPGDAPSVGPNTRGDSGPGPQRMSPASGTPRGQDAPHGPPARKSRNRGGARTTPWWLPIDGHTAPEVRSRRATWIRTVGVQDTTTHFPIDIPHDDEGPHGPV